MNWRCWPGIHRWTYKDEFDGDHLDTYARCKRDGCTRYRRWSLVNRDPVDASRTDTSYDEQKRAS